MLVQLELEKEEKEAAGRERRLVERALEAEQVWQLWKGWETEEEGSVVDKS